MPLFVGDYLRDTGRLTTTEHGAYLLLLMHAWNHNGLLPKEPALLAGMAGVNMKSWPKIWRKIGSMFYETPEGWRQNRLQKEVEKAANKSAARAAAGAQGGHRRALNMQQTGKAIAKPDPSNSEANATKVSSKRGSMPKPEPEVASKLATAGGLREEFLDDVFKVIGPSVADPANCGLEFAVDLWLTNGATPALILDVVKRCTAHKRPKPIAHLRALTTEIDSAIAAQLAAGTPKPPPAPAADVPMPKGPARTVAHAIVETHGRAAYNAWFANAEWNGSEVYAPDEFYRAQIDTRFGGILRELEYRVTLKPAE